MNKEELRKRYDVILDCWNFLKKYAATDLNETADAAIKEASEIHVKHGFTEFAKNLVVEMVNELDRIYKSKAQG